MKQVFGKVCRASFTAAGVMVAASAASAETRPVQLETEFDLDLGGSIGAAAPALAAPQASSFTLDFSSAAAKWEESIGAYLDGLLAADEAPAPQAQEAKAADDAATDAVIQAEIAAFEQPQPAKAEPATVEPATVEPVAQPVALSPQLLAPVLSSPAGCQACCAHLAQARIDDAAAWQKLAEWASSRVAEDAGAAESDIEDDAEAASADGDMLFDFFDGEDEPTE